MSEPIVSIRDLKYRYRGQKSLALQEINLALEQGEFLMLMGPSEAGKSTLAATINGLIPNFHIGKLGGDVVVMGRNTKDYSVAQMAEIVGMVFQDFEAQLFSTNVELEVAFGPENFAVPREEIKTRIDENLEYVGLEGFRNRPPSTLSGGQKQKLAIASVLALKPQVLVMDEPTTDLDPISKMGVFEITHRLCKRDDLTLLIVEHETEEALFADRIALIKEGQLIKVGPTREILTDVALMESLGVMPLGIPKFFKAAGVSELPLTPDEGVETFKSLKFQINDLAYQEMVAREKAKLEQLNEPLIQCQNLSHTYKGEVEALKKVNIEIHRGDMVAIIGQNGSGKTTLAKHFNGLLLPTEGEILVNGKPTREQGIFALGKSVGYVFQNPDHQIFSEKVFDEVAFSPRIRKLPEEEVKQRVSEALTAVGLEGLEEEDPFTLTKSGRQRVAVASVLASNPDVLILDEPTTGLDYSEQSSMMNMVRRLNENGSTIIFITHHMWVVAEYAKRALVMKDGDVILGGSTREVFSQSEVLRDAFLRPPHFVEFTRRLGYTFLTPAEMEACLEGAHS
ncbi:MAG TPA: energy-coupling factor transporter ATPase [Brevefilum sp.]|nr:energy-coupling factor transporter ATPase [Brevefilum sp.]HPL69958.1 energy-coupling factor transporter ATPase [Brevefilum sp.]